MNFMLTIALTTADGIPVRDSESVSISRAKSEKNKNLLTYVGLKEQLSANVSTSLNYGFSDVLRNARMHADSLRRGIGRAFSAEKTLTGGFELYEFRFTRRLDASEALTLERSLVSFGSRLVHDDAGQVAGCVAKPPDLYRWLRRDGIKNLGVQLMGKLPQRKGRTMSPA